MMAWHKPDDRPRSHVLGAQHVTRFDDANGSQDPGERWGSHANEK